MTMIEQWISAGNMSKRSKTPGADDVRQELGATSASAYLDVGHMLIEVDAEDSSLTPYRSKASTLAHIALVIVHVPASYNSTGRTYTVYQANLCSQRC